MFSRVNNQIGHWYLQNECKTRLRNHILHGFSDKFCVTVNKKDPVYTMQQGIVGDFKIKIENEAELVTKD